MRIIFLGTNGWYDTQTGNTLSILIETESHIVLDAGNGIYKLDRYINDSKPIYLFLSHFHLKTGQSDESWPHLNPQVAAKIAREGNAKRLALVHFDAGIYMTLEERKQAKEEARGIFGNTFATVDDMEIEI